MIKDKLLRLKSLYEIWQSNEAQLSKNLTEGKRASLRRNQVFLRGKIESLVKNIESSIHSKLFVVYLNLEPDGIFTYIMRADSIEDLELYINMLNLIEHKNYRVLEIHEIPTIFKGTLKFPQI